MSTAAIPGVWDPEAWRIPRRPRVLVVLDEHDGPEIAAHLAHVGGIDAGRVVVRPTPGTATVAAFALDVLTALGKNPLALDQGHRRSWPTARAWLEAARPTDLVIDRAHRLPAAVLASAADAAAAADATLWLIWPGPTDPAHVIDAMKQARHATETRSLAALRRELPAVPRHTPRDLDTKPSAIRPLLPTADFPLFLAHARRQLTGHAFEQLAAHYAVATSRTQKWLVGARDAIGIEPGTEFDPVPLICWLRERNIGPLRSGYEALITLRATQAVLARVGILLTWDRVGQGQRPENRLPGALTPSLVRALGTLPRTEEALATALALHLEQDGGCFVCWNLADVDPVTLTFHPAADHRHFQPKTERDATFPRDQRIRATARLETACRHPVTLPNNAGPIVLAHLARRRMDGAGSCDPLFTGTHRISPAAATSQAIRRGARHVGHDPWWLDPDRVRKRQRDPRLVTSSWMTERGLALQRIPPVPRGL